MSKHDVDNCQAPFCKECLGRIKAVKATADGMINKAADKEKLMTKYETTTEEVEILVLEARIDELRQFKKINKFGFEHLSLIVKYQDGTSASIPCRRYWNDCYDKFEITLADRIAELTTQLQALKQKARVS